jgi:hypothetical protein
MSGHARERFAQTAIRNQQLSKVTNKMAVLLVPTSRCQDRLNNSISDSIELVSRDKTGFVK